MDDVDHFGPNADIVDQDRRRLITRILVALHTHEEANGIRHGTHIFPSAPGSHCGSLIYDIRVPYADFNALLLPPGTEHEADFVLLAGQSQTSPSAK